MFSCKKCSIPKYRRVAIIAEESKSQYIAKKNCLAIFPNSSKIRNQSV